MKPIEKARAELDASKASGEHDAFMVKVEQVINTAAKLKKVMLGKRLTSAKSTCPLCRVEGALHGRLVVGSAAGRHRASGGAFRMWCDNCKDVKMME